MRLLLFALEARLTGDVPAPDNPNRSGSNDHMTPARFFPEHIAMARHVIQIWDPVNKAFRNDLIQLRRPLNSLCSFAEVAQLVELGGPVKSGRQRKRLLF